MSLRTRLTVLLAVLAGYSLRVWRLDFQELRGDEAFGYFFSQSPYAQIVADTLSLQEPHPVASYFVQKAWLGLAGDSEFALRYVSVWFSVAAIALLFRLARRANVPELISALSAVLLASSPYVIWHSQDARMYSMSLALTLASSLLAVTWLQHRGAGRGAPYVAVSLLALHTHYFAVFILLAQNLFVVVLAFARKIRPAVLGRWLVLQMALAALYAPWLYQARHLLAGYHGNGDSPGLGDVLIRSFSVFAVGESVPKGQRGFFAVAALALVITGAAALVADRRTRRAALWFALYLAVPVLATWYGAVSRPIFDERYLAAAAAPFFVLAASSLLLAARPVGVGQRWRAAAGVAVFALVVVVVGGATASLVRTYVDPAYSKTRGWRLLADTLEQLPACVPADSARLIQNYPDPTLWYYYGGPIEHLVLPPAAQDVDETRAIVAALRADGVRWLAFVDQPAENWDAGDMAQAMLAEQFTRVAEMNVVNWPVEVYVRSPQAFEPLAVDFVNGMALTGYATEPERAAPAGILVVHVQWDAVQLIDSAEMKVFVQLLDGQGRLAAQQDQPLIFEEADAAGGLVVSSYGILLPETLEPGAYSLIVGLYAPDESGSPRISTTAGADHVVLQTVSVGAAEFDRCTENLVTAN